MNKKPADFAYYEGYEDATENRPQETEREPEYYKGYAHALEDVANES